MTAYYDDDPRSLFQGSQGASATSAKTDVHRLYLKGFRDHDRNVFKHEVPSVSMGKQTLFKDSQGFSRLLGSNNSSTEWVQAGHPMTTEDVLSLSNGALKKNLKLPIPIEDIDSISVNVTKRHGFASSSDPSKHPSSSPYLLRTATGGFGREWQAYKCDGEIVSVTVSGKTHQLATPVRVEHTCIARWSIDDSVLAGRSDERIGEPGTPTYGRVLRPEHFVSSYPHCSTDTSQFDKKQKTAAPVSAYTRPVAVVKSPETRSSHQPAEVEDGWQVAISSRRKRRA
jgi:hypothetical protein